MSKNKDNKKGAGFKGYTSQENSPKLSPKDSNSSDDSNYESVDVDNDKGFDPSKFSLKGLEDRTSVGSYGDDYKFPDLEDFEALDQNPIFKHLAEKYTDRPTCKVCGRPFNKLKLIIKKHCKFCGECICEDHGKKSRPNPEKTSEYVRCCDTCDEKFIQKTILGEFRAKLNDKDNNIKEVERKIREQENNIANVRKEYDSLTLQKSKNDKNYSDQMNRLTLEIAEIKDETKKCEKENVELNKEFNKTQKRVEDLDNEIIQAEKEYEKLSRDAVDLTNQIEALNQDIVQMTRTIKNMEENMTTSRSVGPSYDERGPTPGNRDDSISSTTTNDKKPNKMETSRIVKNNINKPKSNADDAQRSGNCTTSCNLF